jgi:predicted dehydrogenase
VSAAAILLGVGGFGLEWREALERHGVTVVGAVDPDREALADAARRYRLPADRASAEDDGAWASWDADFIIDSSPPWLHADHTLHALHANLDVIVAKPLALTLDDAKRVADEASARGRIVLVAQQKRFLPGFLALREIVLSHELGVAGIVNIDLNVDGRAWEPGTEWRLRMEHPLLMEGTVHHIDLIRWVFSAEVESVVADAFNPPWSAFKGDACLNALIWLDNGLRVNYRASWAPRGTPPVSFFSGWTIEFEHGYAELSEGAVNVNGKQRVGASEVTLANLNNTVLDEFFATSAHGTESLLSARNNLNSLAALEACRLSVETGCRIRIVHDDRNPRVEAV